MTTQVSPRPRHGRAGRIVFYVGVALLVLDIVTVLALSIRRRRSESSIHEQRTQAADAGIPVTVTRVELSSTAREITLPADVRSFAQTTLYAKISGYVREMRVERGQHVKAGEVLAVLESPENERDVGAARSDAEAKERIAARMRTLAGPGVVSQQDLDNAERDARVARANLARTLDVRNYKLLRAPFDGVVTARYADPGALLPAATGTTQAALPLVDIADLDRLRIFIYVGQDVAPFVHDGDAVTLWQDEKASEQIPTTITHVAGALDPRTRTMQCEIDLDNRRTKLQPGTFVRARLRLDVPAVPVVPNEAFAVRDGRTVVVVVQDERARFVPVELGPNDGKTTRVLQGLTGGEIIGLSVPVEVSEGAKLKPKPLPVHDAGRTGDGGR
jgi:RND family efflux transporter MFP subunit